MSSTMSFKPSECAAILGSKSRIGKQAADAIGKAYGPELLSISLSRRPGEMVAAIRKAKQKGAKVVAVGGGDGTVRLAAPICMELDLTLAIIPAGTGNALARELNIPLDPVKALELCWSEHEVHGLDVGYLGEQPFVTTASCGLTAGITQALESQPKGLLGRAAYIPAVWHAIRDSQPFRISVKTDSGSVETMASLFVAAASRTHAGPFPTTENAANDDGLLSIYVVEGDDRMGLFRYGLSLLMKKHTEQAHVWSVDAPSADVHVTSHRFILDGDPHRVHDSHVKFTLASRSLKILCPLPDEPQT